MSKPILGAVVTLSAALLAAGTAAPGEARAAVQVTVGVYTDTLSPYGEWVVVRRFGRVWRPNRMVVGAGFRPYASGGHWVHTNYGWSFETDWDWGWLPFHYGRWYADPDYGWVWLPGTTWSPAWVEWRFGGGYVGWAPLAPAGVSVSFASHPASWCVVETPQFTSPHVAYHVVARERIPRVLAATTTVRRGPRPAYVAAAVHQPVQTLHVTPPRPGHPVRVRPVAQAPRPVLHPAPKMVQRKALQPVRNYHGSRWAPLHAQPQPTPPQGHPKRSIADQRDRSRHKR